MKSLNKTNGEEKMNKAQTLRKNGYWVLVNKNYELISSSKNKNVILKKLKENKGSKVFSPLRKIIITSEEIAKYHLIHKAIWNDKIKYGEVA
tara:strand:- start:378 stop:653 length:276 start_codon:yes stop_codon:yes gene_type:complete